MSELTIIPEKPPSLPPQRRRFADAYLAGKNQTQASIEAGYSIKTATSRGSRLVDYDNVKAYLAFHQKQTAKRNEIKLDEIVSGIREVISKCKERKPYQSTQLLKAYELLAKMGGFMKDQGVDQDSRPAFVGISINMGEGTVDMVSSKNKDKSNTKIVSALADTKSIEVTSSNK